MKRRRTKLTPTTIAKIQERRRAGASYTTLARDFDCSEGTIRNALTAEPGAPTPPKQPVAHLPVSESVAPMTREELVAFLSGQARQLRTDIETSPDATARASANRSLVAVQTLISRTLPPQPLDPEVGVFVDAAEMTALGDQVAERYHAMIGMLMEDKPAGAHCRTCSCFGPDLEWRTP